MIAITFVFLALGIVFIGVAAFWNWGQVLEESLRARHPERGIYYLLLQLYAIYYEIVHRRSWPNIAYVYGFFLLGCLCFVFAYLAGRKAGVFPP
jgi:hypothetical protein